MEQARTLQLTPAAWMDLKGPSDFERLSQSILSQLNAISDKYPEVKSLCERIETLQKEVKQNCFCKVALVGFTKAGKSTLLSSLSGYEGLVPTGQGFLSVSYAPLELSFQADNFSLEIIFYTRQEILEQLQEDIGALFSVFKEKEKFKKKMGMFKESVARSRLVAFFGEEEVERLEDCKCQAIVVTFADQKIHLGNHQNHQVANVTVNSKFSQIEGPLKKEHLRLNEIKQVMNENDQLSAAVKILRIRGPVEICRSGITLVDLPGIEMENIARFQKTKEYLQSEPLSYTWFVSEGKGLAVQALNTNKLFLELLLEKLETNKAAIIANRNEFALKDWNDFRKSLKDKLKAHWLAKHGFVPQNSVFKETWNDLIDNMIIVEQQEKSDISCLETLLSFPLSQLTNDLNIHLATFFALMSPSNTGSLKLPSTANCKLPAAIDKVIADFNAFATSAWDGSKSDYLDFDYLDWKQNQKDLSNHWGTNRAIWSYGGNFASWNVNQDHLAPLLGALFTPVRDVKQALQSIWENQLELIRAEIQSNNLAEALIVKLNQDGQFIISLISDKDLEAEHKSLWRSSYFAASYVSGKGATMRSYQHMNSEHRSKAIQIYSQLKTKFDIFSKPLANLNLILQRFFTDVTTGSKISNQLNQNVEIAKILHPLVEQAKVSFSKQIKHISSDLTVEKHGAFEIGSGSQGTIFRGTLKGDGEEIGIAIKEYERGADLKKELEAFRVTNHPSIISTLGYQINPVPCIFFPIFDGDLDKIIPLMTFQKKDRLRLLKDISSAISYLHEIGIIHRDIKPANVLVTSTNPQDCRTILADFGCCSNFALTLNKNKTMTVAGTPGYVAPEAFIEGFTRASDVWAFGILAGQVLNSQTIPLRGQFNGDVSFFQSCNVELPSARPTATSLLQSISLLITYTPEDDLISIERFVQRRVLESRTLYHIGNGKKATRMLQDSKRITEMLLNIKQDLKQFSQHQLKLFREGLEKGTFGRDSVLSDFQHPTLNNNSNNVIYFYRHKITGMGYVGKTIQKLNKRDYQHRTRDQLFDKQYQSAPDQWLLVPLCSFGSAEQCERLECLGIVILNTSIDRNPSMGFNILIGSLAKSA